MRFGRLGKKTGVALAVGALAGSLAGAVPARAHIGDTIAHLWGHLKPKMDQRYLPGGVLPAGKTLRGTYWMGTVAAGASDLATSEISFGYTFAAAPVPVFIQSGTMPPAECPGTESNPQAAPGYLCIYEGMALNAGVRDVNGPGSADGGTYPFGARLFVRSSAAGNFWSLGTWAATSGAAAPASAAVTGSGTIAGE